MKHTPGFLKIAETARQAVKEVEPEDVLTQMKQGDNIYLVDVREESEWGQGHLPQAIHLSKGVIERDIETRIPDLDSPIILYCGGGYRSALAARNLMEMGYTEVYSMVGGYRAWIERGLPLKIVR